MISKYTTQFFNALMPRRAVSVLMYHRINDQLKPNDWIMPTTLFREQMRYLHNSCDVLTLRTFLDSLKKGGFNKSKRPQVLITIDDGYKDNFDHAFPIIQEFKLPVTIFLATGFMGTDRKMGGYEDLTGRDMLNWDEIMTMYRSGVTFCSHTNHHPHLPQLSKSEQHDAIKDAIDMLYQKLGDPLINEVFCYPYGEYNQDTLEVLRSLGVQFSFAVHHEVNYASQPPLLLNRFTCSGYESMSDLYKRLRPDIKKAISWRMDMLKQGKKW